MEDDDVPVWILKEAHVADAAVFDAQDFCPIVPCYSGPRSRAEGAVELCRQRSA